VNAVLCVANYPANTGYAWDFIERIYSRLADHLATHGVRTYVAYPRIPAPPRTLQGSAATAVELDATLGSVASVQATRRFIRDHHIGVLYLTDLHARSLAYPLLRAAGAQLIVLHDHTSGERTAPHGLKRAAKWLLAQLPGITADVILTVSDYVARRQRDVGLVPAKRVLRVWNGLSVPAADAAPSLAAVFGWEPGRPVIACACRATPEKGVDQLLHGFAALLRSWPEDRPRPVLLYIGAGPQLETLQTLRQTLGLEHDAFLPGYRTDAATLLTGADICVVPSVWQDAFPLSVLETMARAKPIVATAVGGIPEMIEHDRNGLLVPPADPAALASAIRQLLDEPSRARRLGDAARTRVAERFTPDRQLASIAAVVEPSFGPPCAFARHAGIGA
jgi:glycosyltransferase involved in cell wall biosynthesis